MINILLSLKDYNRPLVYFFAAIEFSICFVSNIFTDSVRKVNSKSEKQDRILLSRNRQTEKNARGLYRWMPLAFHINTIIDLFFAFLCKFMYSSLFCQLQISVFDPTGFAQEEIDQRTNDSRKNDRNQG